MSRIVLTSLRKTYGTKRAVDDVSLDIRDGEFLSLLGPSGCGKTTILRALAGLEHPDAGVITLGDLVVTDPKRRVFVPPNRRDIGLVFQSYALWPHMTVAGNVAYPLKARGRNKATIPSAVASALELVGLEGYEDRSSMALSGGQQQRVALARALVSQPGVLLLDEPLSNLDARRRTQLRAELRHIHRNNPRTTVYVTHDQVEALSLSDRIAVMDQGRVQQIGSPREVFRNPRNRFVAGFLGYDNFFDGHVVRVHGDAVTVRLSGVDRDVHVSSAGVTWPQDAAVTVAIRSEDFDIASTATSGHHLPGVVEDAVDLGLYVEYTIRHRDRRLLVTGPPHIAHLTAPIGADVSLTVDPFKAALIAA